MLIPYVRMLVEWQPAGRQLPSAGRPRRDEPRGLGGAISVRVDGKPQSMRFLGFARGVGVMQKNYEKPTLIRRQSLTEIAAGTMVIASSSDQNGDNNAA